MRKSKRAFMLMMGSLAAGCMLAAVPAQPVMRVETAVIQPGELIQSVWLSGYVRYAEETPCVSISGGRISEIYVKEGDRVQTGDLLFRFDSKIKELELASLYAIKNNHDTKLSQIPISGSILNRQTEAEWSAAREQLKSELACTQIRAEQDGIVEDILITKGTFVESTSVLAKIRGEEKCIAVTAGIRDAGLIETGASVFVEKADQTIPGYVWQILPSNESGLKTVLIKLTNDEFSDQFQLGEMVKAEVVTGIKSVPAMIPLAASDAEGNIWFIEEGIVHRVNFEWKECGAEHAGAGSEWTGRTVILYPETSDLKNGMHARVSE